MSAPLAELDREQWQRLNRLLEEALTLDDLGRERWLANLQGEPAELQAVLRQLLAEHAVDAPTHGDTLARLMLAALPAADAPGDQVGPYRLLHVLGQGGMSTVWAAERADGRVRRRVALKIPHADWSDRALSERLSRECKVLADLNHPHIAHLYDAGAADNGRPYLALELVEGESIDRSCATRGLDTRARVALFIDVLEAVAYAHARLVVHRDLKPANVMVTAEGQVKLLDFGIAKMLASESGGVEETELTRQAGRPLTLAYAAPEQVLGAAVTTATDIYALGALLYELLTGVRACKPRSDSRAALEEAILSGHPALPSSVAKDAQAARLLRGDLDAILLKALSTAPEARYPTAQAFADELRRFLEGRTVHARLASRRYRIQRFLARNRLMAGTVVMIAAALVSGLTIALWQAHEAANQAGIAAHERDRALAALEYRDAVDGFLSDLLQEAGRTGRPVSIPELIDRADAMSAKEFAQQPEARAAVLKTVGDFKVDVEGMQAASAYFERAMQLLEGSPDTGLRAIIGCNLALLRGASGNAGSIDDARRELAAIIGRPGTPAAASVECLASQAQLELFDFNGAAAARAVARALGIWRTTSRRSPRQHAILLVFGAEAQSLVGDLQQAESGATESLAELRRLGGDRGEWGARARFALIECARKTGDPRTALSLVDEAIGIVHADVPDKATPIYMQETRAAILADMGRYDAAADAYLQGFSTANGGDRSVGERLLLAAAMAEAHAGRIGAAEQHYRQAVALADAADGASASAHQYRLRARAVLDLGQGNFQSATQTLTTALAMAGTPASSRAILRELRAEARLGTGALAEAAQDARQALELDLQMQGGKAFSARVARDRLLLGRIEQAQGDPAGSHADLVDAEHQFAAALGNDAAWTRQAHQLASRQFEAQAARQLHPAALHFEEKPE